MDSLEKEIYYKIEPRFHLTQQLDVIRYPEKKKTARLGEKFQNFVFYIGVYRAELSILDKLTNRWIQGEIKETGLSSRQSYDIRWNGHYFSLTKAQKYRTYEFRDENNKVVADYFIQPDRGLRVKFDMKIYSNQYPDEIYLLGLAAHDRFLASQKRAYSDWNFSK